MYLIDLTGEHHPVQLTYTIDEELNGNKSLSASIMPSKINLQFLHELTEMWTLVVNDVEFKIVYIKKNGEGNKLKADIKGIPLFYDKFNTQRIYERYDQHMTANAYFTLVFQSSDYNFILNGTFEAQQWEGAGEGATRLEMFQNGLNRYKAEFRIVGNTIYIENMIGIDSQFRYEHRLNASNIVQEIDANELWTYAKGYGNYGDGEGGEDWQNAKLFDEYTSPLANIPGIGIRHAPPIKNGNITKIDTLKEQLKILVDESLKISVTANIHDLRKQGYPIAQSSLGDRVFLIDPRIGFDDEIRIAAKSETRNWKGEILDLKLTFGVPGLVKRHQANLSAAVKNITSLLEGKIKLPFSVLDNAVAEATKALHNMTSELSIPPNGGLMAVDKTNPNNLVLFNAAGIGVSDDGGATFGNALTGLGLNVDYVYAGTMLADRIAGGILQSLNGNLHFDMNLGNFDMQNANFTLNNGARINFTDPGNKITYRKYDSTDGYSRAAGFGVGDRIGGRYSFVYVGTNGSSELNTLDEFYTGLVVNTSAAMWNDGADSSMNGPGFQFRNKAIGWDKAITIDFRGTPTIIPMTHGSTDLGTANIRFRRAYVDNILGWRTVYISNPTANRGFAIDTDFVDGHNPSIYGQYPFNNNYNIGRSDRPMTYVYTNTVHANYLYGALQGGSARRLKTNEGMMDINDSIEFIRNAEIVTFDWIRDEELKFNRDKPQTIYDKQVGFIIDDLIMQNDYLVKADEETIKKDNIIFIHQHVLQNLLQRVEELENGTEPTTA